MPLGRVVAILCCLLLLWQGVATASELGSRTLKLGDRGSDVRELQERLSTLGIDPGATDGIFGPQTLAAVLAFQASRGLTADGVVGAETLAALEYISYRVEPGDTVSRLAQKFGVSERVIIELNQLENPDVLQVGQELLIRVSAASRPTFEPLLARGRTEGGRLKGELVPWEEVHPLVSPGTVLTLIDINSGISFQAQRRGGHLHMDMEPCTAQDTRNMRTIYGGNWSWERKAVVVKIGDRLVAASMNGMPHGNSDITGNNFPGHFCLHFLGSALHKTGSPDPDHQAMVLKAAGAN